MKKFLSFSVAIIFASISFAQIEMNALDQEQDSIENLVFKEVSINISPLLFKLVPFANTETKSGPFAFSYTWGYNEHGFRLGFGFDLISGEFRESYAMIRVGYEFNRELIHEKLIMHSTYDFWIGGGGFNIPQRPNDADGIIGFAGGIGLKYFLTDKVFLSTESQLYLGSYDGFILQVIPPISVNLGFRI